MTAFDLWQASGGSEPAVIADLELVARFREWCAVHWEHYLALAPDATRNIEAHDREAAEAAEECRAALAVALFGGWVYGSTHPPAFCVVEVAYILFDGTDGARTARAYHDGEWRYESGDPISHRVYAWREIPPAPPLEAPCAP